MVRLSGLIAIFWVLQCADGAQAQESVRRVAVSGTIIDAESRRPLAFAAVSLEPAPAGVFPQGASGLQQTRVTYSSPSGEYRFHDVPQGDYRLHVQRIGYRSRSVDVRVRPELSARVSVGLEIEPVALESVEVAAGASAGLADAYARRSRDLDELARQDARRVATERLRQRLYLSSDVRAVTHADVAEGLSLGETDLFRSLHRFPGVSTTDEWSAELWTRGAPWDQTRVYFDGMPLFNALHALGAFSGVNADAIGAAFLHPGSQPAALGGGGAGALDIRSRTGSGTGALNGVGELSLASARVALDRRSANADHAWMVAGRRTYVDLATRLLAPLIGEEARVPYTFYDLAGRADLQLSSSTALELSGLITSDHAHGEIADVLENTRAKWGGGVARATLSAPLFGLRARHTIGYSHYGSTVRDTIGDDPGDIFTVEPQHDAQNRLHYYVARAELQALGTDDWNGGYELAHYRVSYRGDNPSANLPNGDSLHYGRRLSVAAAWLQRRISIADRATADLGLRLETGSATANRGAIGVAPRASTRVQFGSQTTGSVSVGRTWQYTQALAPAGITPIEGFASDFLWLLADDTTAALRSDVATVGIERWLGQRWIMALNGYVRRTTGVNIPDPNPGELLLRPLFVTAENRAHGLELSVRRLTGRLTGSAAYSYGRSTLKWDTLQFAAPGDQRHTVDIALGIRVGTSWLAGAAYTGTSGTPYTRKSEGLLACDSVSCAWQESPRQEEPGALRRAGYHSLDLNLEWVRRFQDWRLAAFLQVRNLLNRANQGRYLGVETICTGRCGTDPEGDEFGFIQRDEFLPGLPMIPLLGLRISF